MTTLVNLFIFRPDLYISVVSTFVNIFGIPYIYIYIYMENSAVATGLEKVSFHSNPKERQCQRMFKLLHNCTHLTR